jgi:shikimate kinase
MARLEAERRPYYQEVADLVVDVDNDHTADWVTERLVRELGLSSPIR